MDKCAKHDETMDRIFSKMNDAEVRLERIDTNMSQIIAFKDMVHTVIYGNGKPGIKGETEKNTSGVKKLWGFFSIILTSIVAAAVAIMWTH